MITGAMPRSRNRSSVPRDLEQRGLCQMVTVWLAGMACSPNLQSTLAGTVPATVAAAIAARSARAPVAAWTAAIRATPTLAATWAAPIRATAGAATILPAARAAPTLAAAGPLVTGEPGTHRRQFLAGRDAAALAPILACRPVGLQHVAVDIAARRTAPALATVREIVGTHAIERGQFARLVVAYARPCMRRLAGRLDFGDAARRVTLVQHRLQSQCRLYRPCAGDRAQILDRVFGQRLVLPRTQSARQFDVAVTDALQAADQQSLRIPQAAHFAVAAFVQDHAEPAVAAAAADHVDLVEARGTVFQFDAGFQFFQHLVGHFTVHAAEVLAFEFVAGVHQCIREFAIGGEQQQAGGVHVQAAHRDPARTIQVRQVLEHGRTAFGVVARGEFAFGLVVHQHLRVLV